MIQTVKLMTCTICGDILRLLRTPRACRCKQSYGRQVSLRKVEIQGPCIVVGLQKHDFERALQGDEGLKKPLKFYYIPSGDQVISTNALEYEGEVQ